MSSLNSIRYHLLTENRRLIRRGACTDTNGLRCMKETQRNLYKQPDEGLSSYILPEGNKAILSM